MGSFNVVFPEDAQTGREPVAAVARMGEDDLQGGPHMVRGSVGETWIVVVRKDGTIPGGWSGDRDTYPSTPI